MSERPPRRGDDADDELPPPAPTTAASPQVPEEPVTAQALPLVPETPAPPAATGSSAAGEPAAGEPATPPAKGRSSVSGSMLTVLFGNFFPAFAALITGPILARALSTDGRGEVAAATAPLALITTIVTFGIPEAVTFAAARWPWLIRNVAARGAAILSAAGLLAMGVVFLASSTLSGGDAGIRTLILIASLAAVPTLMVSVLRGVASAAKEWRLVTTERILTSSLRLLALVPFFLTDTLTPLVATIAVAAMPVTGGLVYLRLLRRLPARAREIPPEARVPGMLSYGMRIWAGSISGVLLTRVDQTIMTPLAGSYELGLYVVAVSVGELPLIINSAVRDVTFVSDASESDDKRLAASARISTTVCAIAALIIGLPLSWWLPLAFDEDFRGAVPVAAILLVATVLGTPGSIGGTALGARGRPGLRSWSLIVACLVNIGLLVLLLPHLGAVGAALATLVGNLLASNLNLYFLHRFFGLSPWQFYGVRRSDLRTLRAVGGRLLRRLRGGRG